MSWPWIFVILLLLGPVPAVAQKPPAFQDGVSDRNTWEDWFGDTGGEFRAGAEYWANHRYDVAPAQCRAAAPPHTDQWIEGCEEAQSRSTRFDRRLKIDPFYRQGWNSVRARPTPEEGSAISPVLPRRKIEVARHQTDPAPQPPPAPVAAAPPDEVNRPDAFWPLLLILAVFAAAAGLWKLRSK